MERNLNRELLREAITICENSTVYRHIDRQEKREAISYIYNLLALKGRPHGAETDNSA